MNYDELIFRALNHAGSNPALDLLMVSFTFIGFIYILAWVGPILWWRKQQELGFDVVVLLILASFIVEGLKLLIARERPYMVLSGVNMLHWGSLTFAGDYSMPSSHATLAFALATLITLTIGRRIGVAVLLLATLIGLSRIYLGLHWPSDVLAGALLGIGLALIMNWIRLRDNRYTRARDRAVAWMRGKRGSAVNGAR